MNWEPHVPKDFKRGNLAPPDADLEWMAAFLACHARDRAEWNILEFGCGITTMLLTRILKPAVYVGIETWQPAIESVWTHLPKHCSAIFQGWESIKSYRWNFVFIDSSSGCGKAVGHHRDLSLRASMPYLAKGAVVLFHDSKHGEGKKVRRVIEADETKWEWLDESFNGRGLAAYRWKG